MSLLFSPFRLCGEFLANDKLRVFIATLYSKREPKSVPLSSSFKLIKGQCDAGIRYL